jgi:polysaccharide pyruvyl transferase WcaK-like protein
LQKLTLQSVSLLIKVGGFSNKGDEAMMRTVQRELSRRIPGADFAIRVPARQADLANAAGFSATIIERSRLKKAMALLRWAASSADRFHALMTSREAAMEMADIGEVDGVLDISGFGYSDVWGTGFTSRGLGWARYCQGRNVPLLCLPQAWGPFRNPGVAAQTREICRRSRFVFARDRESERYLGEILRDTGVEIRAAPDIAFSHQGARPAVGAGILSALGVRLDQRPVVGLTPNTRIYYRTPGEGQANQYVEFMVEVARFCIQEWKAQVVLLPHEYAMGDKPKRDDRFLCGLIQLALAAPEHCVSLSSFHTAEEMKSIISHLDLLIGSRFHSLVFALASAVPVVAVGWAHKYAELMELFGLEGYAVEHQQLDFAAARTQLHRAWTCRAETAAKISRCLPAIRQRVDGVFDEVAAALLSAKEGRNPKAGARDRGEVAR